MKSNRAVQWHYIEKHSNDTVPNHTVITTNALFIYNRTKITGWFPVLPLKNVPLLSARLAQLDLTEQPYYKQKQITKTTMKYHEKKTN